MMRVLLAVLAVYVAWSVLDVLIHGMLLQDSYQATASLWRPMDEMKWGLMHGVTLVYSACFTLIYSVLVAERSMKAALGYGALFGLAAGISVGFGSYAYMPIPLSLAVAWFAGTLFQSLVAGAVVGAILKPAREPRPAG